MIIKEFALIVKIQSKVAIKHAKVVLNGAKGALELGFYTCNIFVT